MRVVAAWIVGIVTTFALGLLFVVVGDAIGVPAFLDRETFEDESNTTTYGLAVSVFAAMLGARAGMWVAAGTPRLSPVGNIEFIAWLSGVGIVAVTGAAVSLALRGFRGTLATIAYVILDLSGVAVAWFIAKTWRDRRLSEIAPPKK